VLKMATEVPQPTRRRLASLENDGGHET
jgi:hypothetical protein